MDSKSTQDLKYIVLLDCLFPININIHLLFFVNEYKVLAKRSQQFNATYRNIVGRDMLF